MQNKKPLNIKNYKDSIHAGLESEKSSGSFDSVFSDDCQLLNSSKLHIDKINLQKRNKDRRLENSGVKFQKFSNSNAKKQQRNRRHLVKFKTKKIPRYFT